MTNVLQRSVIVMFCFSMTVIFNNAHAAGKTAESSVSYLAAVRAYADTMLEKGRDRWGGVQSPLFVSMLDRRTHELWDFKHITRWTHENSGVEIVSYKKKGKQMHGFGAPASDRMPDSANLGHDEHLYLTLYRLSDVTGDANYAESADAALRYFWLNCQDANTGMMAWGEHMAWHLPEDTWWSSAREGHSRIHEPAPWPAELWDRCYAMGDEVQEALKKYAMGVWKWQVANHEKAWTNRHVYPDGFPNVARKGREYPRLVGQFCRYWTDAYAHSSDEAFRAEMIKGIESFVSNSIRRAKPNGALPFGTAEKLQNYYQLTHQFIMLRRLHYALGVVPDETGTEIRKLMAMTEAVILDKLDHHLDPAAEYPGYLRAAEADTLNPGDARKKHQGKENWNDLSIAYTGTWNTPIVALHMLDYYEQTGNERFRELGLKGADLVLALTGDEPEYPENMRPYEMAKAVQMMVKSWDITGDRKYLDQGECFGRDAIPMFTDDISPLPAVMALPNKYHKRIYEARTGGDDLMFALLQLHEAVAAQDAGK